MSDDDRRSEALQALAGFMLAEASVGETLQRVVGIVTAAVPAAHMAGIAMHDEDGSVATRVFTDPDAPAIDEAQYRADRGPCLDSWRRQAVVRVDDLREAADQYPEFVQAALDHGVGSTLSLPLGSAECAVGALTLYAAEPEAFDDHDEALGGDIAAAAAVVLSNSAAYWEVFGLNEHLQDVMRARSAIEQAKGIVMARRPGTDPDAALALLRDRARRDGVPLQDVVQLVLDRRGDAL